ncbi:hypothetical protein WIW50_13555 [Flavobacteriaceae bacterium 3-367]|uniref:hypothetical protein n=1 Tax=Eudoraea algarum TaxID=3417568 RepID=UPI00327424AA
MPIHQDNFKGNLSFKFESDLKLKGLNAFKRSLERDFFSEVNIRHRATNDTESGLIIELEGNFGLHEILYHLKNETWGNMIKKDAVEHGTSPFLRTLHELRELNQLHIDIEEFSLFLKDTAIIVNKVYEQSIPDQLENIMTSIAEHYVYFTKELTEIPYEMYIPVFEESLLENDATLANIRTGNNTAKDYFSFWGLYFDSEDDAVIYDLANRSIVYGDLYMLNH